MCVFRRQNDKLQSNTTKHNTICLRNSDVWTIHIERTHSYNLLQCEMVGRELRKYNNNLTTCAHTLLFLQVVNRIGLLSFSSCAFIPFAVLYMPYIYMV